MEVADAEALNAACQALLPFCSDKTPNHRNTGRKTLYQQKTSKCPMPNDFSTRSEGYRSWPLRSHNPKVAGSNAAPATMESRESKEGGRVARSAPFAVYWWPSTESSATPSSRQPTN